MKVCEKLKQGQKRFEGAEVKQKKCDEKTAQHVSSFAASRRSD